HRPRILRFAVETLALVAWSNGLTGSGRSPAEGVGSAHRNRGDGARSSSRHPLRGRTDAIAPADRSSPLGGWRLNTRRADESRPSLESQSMLRLPADPTAPNTHPRRCDGRTSTVVYP